MKSGSAHCDPELADEVRQCPLRSGAGEEAAEEERRRRPRAALIKSINPHLAGGEQSHFIVVFQTQFRFLKHV